MIKKSIDRKVFNTIAYIVVIITSLICILPFVFVISGSFSDQKDIYNYGYSIVPKSFSLEAYKIAFLSPNEILRAYINTIGVTIVGTCVGLILTAMTGYVLSRKDFEWRNKISFFFYFTMVFNVGLVPWYIICVNFLKLNDTYLALLIPFIMNVFYILVMKSFMSSIPQAIHESARVDGANDILIFIKIILPISKPALASIGLFIALGYWNDWYTSFMFISNKELYSLQFYLYKVVSGAEALQRLSNVVGVDTASIPTETLKLAMTVIATGPIVLLYPYIQKYFIKGLTIGAVKG